MLLPESLRTTVAVDNRNAAKDLIFQTLQKKDPSNSLFASDLQQQKAAHYEMAEKVTSTIQAQIAILFLATSDRVSVDFFTYKRLQEFSKTNKDPALTAVLDAVATQRLASLHECITLGGMDTFWLRDIFSQNPHSEKKLWLDLLFYTATNRGLPLRCPFRVSVQDIEQEKSYLKNIARVSPIEELEEALHLRSRPEEDLNTILLEPLFVAEVLEPQYREDLENFLRRLDAIPKSFLVLDRKLGALLPEPRAWIWHSTLSTFAGLANALPKHAEDDQVGVLADENVWQSLISSLLDQEFDEARQTLSELTGSGSNPPKPNTQRTLEHIPGSQAPQTKKESKQRI